MMKRGVWIAIICISGSISSAFAQFTSTLGLKGGVQGSRWIYPYHVGKGSPGFNLGVSYNLSSVNHFGLTSELFYSAQGFKKVNGLDKTTIDLNYVQLNVLPTIYVGNALYDNKMARIFAGPQFGFLVEQNMHYPDSEVRQAEKYNDRDLGITFGAGLNFRFMKFRWITVDARATRGLRDIDPDPNVKSFNSVLSLNLGINFPLTEY
jgi:hypothetical protein